MELANRENNEDLLSILQDIQAECGYLPEEKLIETAKTLNIPLIDVYGVATFYKSFSLTPRGRHLVKVCLGTACHVRGAVKVLDRIEWELGIGSGETSEDLRFSLETVNCIGACALGPIAIIDGEHYGQMKTNKVAPILKGYD